jgi:hypothetical protein
VWLEVNFVPDPLAAARFSFMASASQVFLQILFLAFWFIKDSRFWWNASD